MKCFMCENELAEYKSGRLMLGDIFYACPSGCINFYQLLDGKMMSFDLCLKYLYICWRTKSANNLEVWHRGDHEFRKLTDMKFKYKNIRIEDLKDIFNKIKNLEIFI